MVPRVFQVVRVGVAALVAVAVSVSSLEPAWGEPADEGGVPPAEPGGFSVGDGVEALIDPRDGALSFTLPVGGVEVSWDSRRLGSDRLGLGPGWAIPVTAIDTRGGVRVTPRSGRVHEASAADDSGLLGYDGEDVRFEAGTAPVPVSAPDAASAPTSPEERPLASFTLHELGGARTWFDAAGNPLARVEASGLQTRWEWDGSVQHRLRGVIDAHGVVTSLDWRKTRNAVVVTPGANLPEAADREWLIERGRGGMLTAVVDPLGGRYEVEYADALVTALTVPSGARTEMEWASSDDGQSRVARVRTVDGDGAELSAREWASRGSSSGWPISSAGPAAGRQIARGAEYETVLGDGASRVRSVYDGAHRLRSRSVLVATASGERTVQEQRLDYPGDGARGGAELPAGWSRPTAVTVTHVGADGATRSMTERTVSDPMGRPVERTSSDGTSTRVHYDPELPADARVPIGLPIRETVTAPDGLVRETEHTLNAERTAVVATEVRTGTTGALTPIERTEYVVRADGFVTEQRSFPGGNAQTAPVVVTRTERIDLATGTSTITETRPAPAGATGPAGPVGTATTSTTISLLHEGATAETDATGRTASTAYDALGRPLTTTDVAGRTASFAHETAQHDGRNATVVSLPGGLVGTEERDALGRVVKVTDNVDDGVATPGFERVAETRSYPSPGVVRVTDAWGATTETTSDVFGRAERVESPSGLVTLTEYDDVAGTVATAVTPTGSIADAELVTTKRTDEADRSLTTTVDRVDGVETPPSVARADGLGRPVFADDGATITEVVYDPAGNPVSTTTTPRNGGATVRSERRFDAFGTSLEKIVTDDSGTRSGGSRTTDALGRVDSERDQRGSSTSVVAATVDGLPLKAVESTGVVRSSEYDELTRALVRTTVESPVGATVSTEVEHDPGTGRIVAVFDPADPAASRIEYRYDDFGNLLETRYPDGAAIGHEYDAQGRLESTTDATGRKTVFGYDVAGRLIEAVQHDGGADAPVLARAAYRYDAFDRVDRVEFGNGVVTEYAFTSASEIASERTMRGDEVLAEREYTYDAGGKLMSRTDEVRSARGGHVVSTTTGYEYDAHDRLVRSSVVTGAAERSTEYRVGLAGDVDAMTEEDGAGNTVMRVFAYSPVGELVSITSDGVTAVQEYDVKGNLVRAADGTVMTYDAANRLATRTGGDGATATTRYWADGSRREVTETGSGGDAPVSTTFHWAEGELVNETHRQGGESATVSYLLGADRHARTVTPDSGAGAAAPITRYAETDRHGNVTGLTDAAGVPVIRYEYTDYGVTTEQQLTGASAQPEASTPLLRHALRNPYRYAGEYADPDGTQPLGQRVYDAATMRFTTEDPASSEFTRYGYADLNPITRADPTGEAAADVVHWAVTALIVAVTVAGTILDLATAGTAMAVVGVAVLGAVDVAFTLADAANQQTQFMPENVAMTIGFVVAAASLLTAGMIRRRSPSPPAERTTGSREMSIIPAGRDGAGSGGGPTIPPERPRPTLASLHQEFVAAMEERRIAYYHAHIKDLMTTQIRRLGSRFDRYVDDAQALVHLERPTGAEFETWYQRWMELDTAGVQLARDIYRLTLDIRKVLASWFVARRILLEQKIPAEVVDIIGNFTIRTDDVIVMDFTPVATRLLSDDFRHAAAETLDVLNRRRLSWAARDSQTLMIIDNRLAALRAFPALPRRY
jgi:RHS repeat-associated protein